MSAVSAPIDYDELRRHVRGTQHARSIPLLVIGVLFVNYAVANFGTHPVAWGYGSPLAFVLIWGLNKLNEQLTGVGAARGDYLVAAGVVFIATNVLGLFTRLAVGSNFSILIGAWVAIVGFALAAVSRAGGDGVLTGAGLLVVVTGVLVGAFGSVNFSESINGFTTWTIFTRSPSIMLIAALGTVLGLTGLLLYRSERATQ